MKYRDPSTGQFKDLHVKVSDTVPIGASMEWNGSTPPEGWLIEDGSAVSRTVYSALFAAIGTTYGAGDGSTTFNLPDHRDRVGVGKSSDTEFNTLGKTGGSKTHTLTTEEIPSHNHSGTTNVTGEHTHAINFDQTLGSNTLGLKSGVQEIYTGDYDWIRPAGSHSHTFTTGSTGGGQAHNNLQPYLVTNYIIKAYQVVAAPAKVGDLFPVGKVEIFFDNEDHSNYLGFTWERIAQGRTLIGIDSTDSDFDTIGEFGGSKTHTLTKQELPQIDITTNYASVVGGDGSGLVYGTSIGASDNNLVYNVNTGGNQPHNIMNPYIVVAIWRRVS